QGEAVGRSPLKKVAQTVSRVVRATARLRYRRLVEIVSRTRPEIELAHGAHVVTGLLARLPDGQLVGRVEHHGIAAGLVDRADDVEIVERMLAGALLDVDLVAAADLVYARYRGSEILCPDLVAVPELVDDQHVVVAVLAQTPGGVAGARLVVAPVLADGDGVGAADLAEPGFIADVLRQRPGGSAPGEESGPCRESERSHARHSLPL